MRFTYLAISTSLMLVVSAGCHTISKQSCPTINACEANQIGVCCNPSEPCASYASCCSPLSGGASSKLAKKTLSEMQCTSGCRFSRDYRDGFETAFNDIANGGKGVLPPVPAKKYWAEKYRCPQGAIKVEEWYAGYQSGVQSAFMKNVHQCNQVRTRQDYLQAVCTNCPPSQYGLSMSHLGVITQQAPETELSTCAPQGPCTAPQYTAPQHVAPQSHMAPSTPPSTNQQKPTPVPTPTAPPKPTPAEKPAAPSAQLSPGFQPLNYEVELPIQTSLQQPSFTQTGLMTIGGQASSNPIIAPVEKPMQYTTPANVPSSWGELEKATFNKRIDSWLR